MGTASKPGTHTRNLIMAALTWVILGFHPTAVFGAAVDDVAGFWTTDDSILKFETTGEGLSAIVVALKDPLYLATEELGEVGSPRLDDRNADPTLRSRKLLGMNLLADYRFEAGKWQGRIYDPKSGKTYSSTIERSGRRLKMRGYVGIPLFGRTQLMEPVSTCFDYILEMIETSVELIDDCN